MLDSERFQPAAPGSCDERALSSANVTGAAVVLCSAPWLASTTPAGQGLVGAAARVAQAGARGLIFAHQSSNVVDNTDLCRRFAMPCVLVDFEVAHRIASYADSAE